MAAPAYLERVATEGHPYRRALYEPLEGRTVIVTRAASQAADLTTSSKATARKSLFVPTIEIREPESYERLDEALDHLYGYDWLIFTSTNGVEFFLKRLTDRGITNRRSRRDQSLRDRPAHRGQTA